MAASLRDPPGSNRFFGGSWVGEGEIVGRGLLRLLMPREPYKISTQVEQLSETVWIVRDLLEFARGGEMRRTMFIQHTAENR